MATIGHIPFVILCFFLACFGTNGAPQSHSDIIDAEIQEVDRQSDKLCWEKGGTPISPCNPQIPNDPLRGGIVKLIKTSDGSLEALNYGYPFISKTDGSVAKTLLNTPKDIELVGNVRDGGSPTVYLFFYADREDWETESPRGLTYSKCVIIHDYKCLQHAIISSESDYTRFEQLNCKRLHGDLIISGFRFDNSKKYPALGNLESILGRVIIHNNVGNFDLSFTKLVTIEDQEIHLSDRSVQITGNRLSSINFPNLDSAGNRSIVFGENFVFANHVESLPVLFGQKPVKPVYLPKPDYAVTEKEEQTKKTKKKWSRAPKRLESWMDEKYMIENNISYKIINIYQLEVCPDDTCDKSLAKRYLITGFVGILLSIAIVFYFSLSKSKETFQLQLILPRALDSTASVDLSETK